MVKYKRKPTTPGEILLEEYLYPLEITQRELADHLGVDYKVINRVINGRSKLTVDLAMKLAMALETTPDFWLNAQMSVDLWNLQSKKEKIPSLLKRRAA